MKLNFTSSSFPFIFWYSFLGLPLHFGFRFDHDDALLVFSTFSAILVFLPFLLCSLISCRSPIAAGVQVVYHKRSSSIHGWLEFKYPILQLEWSYMPPPPSNGQSDRSWPYRHGPARHHLSFTRQLHSLDLSGNMLHGYIQLQLGGLSHLRTLTLSFNQLDGNIPIELGSLTHLQVLNLGANSLTGTIPSFIANFSALTVLALGGNRLTGAIPPQLGVLTSWPITKWTVWHHS